MDDFTTIDESLYSRQLYVLGRDAMQKMATSNVLVAGINGVGVEIVKNVALAGVKSVALWDPKPAALEDLSSQFYLSEDDLGKPRAEASQPHLAQLNQYTSVCVVTGQLLDLLADYDVLAYCEDDLEQAVLLDRKCREVGTKFIWVTTHGLVGSIFNDLGDDFAVTDINGEEPITGTVATIDADGDVLAPESARHGLEDNMVVEFHNILPAELNGRYRVKVSGPFSFNIGKLPVPYEKGGDWIQMKEPETIHFESLESQIAKPEMFVTDFAKFDRPPQLHVISLALSAFRKKKGALPRPFNEEDAAEMVELAHNVVSQYPGVLDGTKLDTNLVGVVSKQARGSLVPVNSVIGGMAAQEVLKAVSGKFMPTRQWMYYDALEALPENITEEDAKPRGCRYDAEYAVLGKPLMDKIADLNVFLVGAGAIGCEVLKNWAMLGFGRGPNGHITVTDNDSIERSNLNRQFLFRPKDVGQPKSLTAVKAVAKMNKDIDGRFTALTDKVCPESQNVFDDKFWQKLDIVTNALDNVEARVYVDSRCVFYEKPLIDSGTLGSKGNVQVVVPYVTESYASSYDPPEKNIPLCTLRSFPSQITHTIAWAKAQFDELFHDSMVDVNNYLTQPNFVESTLRSAPNQKRVLERICNNLVLARPLRFEECIKWAFEQFEQLFRNDIEQLLFNFPPDAKTTNGEPFWAPPKRQPMPLEFDAGNPHHVEFIVAAANLRAFNYGLKGESDAAIFHKELENCRPTPYEPATDVRIAATDEEIVDASGDISGDEFQRLTSRLPPPSSLAGFRVHVAEFEKDDDTNYHISFINAASNLRAINYHIEPVDRSRTKMIAGRIIPAIATTTALVTGLAVIETLKVVQKKKQDDLKNGFVNLALPFFGFSTPITTSKITYNGDKEIDKVWGRFDIQGDLTLKELLDYFKREHGLTLSMISAASTLLYMSFYPPKKIQERLPMRISALVETVSKKPLPKDQSTIVLEICAEDESGEDIDDLPFVAIHL